MMKLLRSIDTLRQFLRRSRDGPKNNSFPGRLRPRLRRRHDGAEPTDDLLCNQCAARPKIACGPFSARTNGLIHVLRHRCCEPLLLNQRGGSMPKAEMNQPGEQMSPAQLDPWMKQIPKAGDPLPREGDEPVEEKLDPIDAQQPPL